MHRLLTDLLAKNTYDLVHLEPFYVWPSIPNTDVPVVVSEHNVEYEVYSEYVKKISLLPLRLLSAMGCRKTETLGAIRVEKS